MSTTPNFDRVARAYRWCEYLALGPLLERTRSHHLAALGTAQRVLVLGDGDGRFTEALLAAYPALDVQAVDLSARMLELLHRRCPAATLHRADARSTLPAGPFDLIVTHFFLDCLTQPELDSLVARVDERVDLRVASGALWLVSEFRVPAGWLSLPARAYVRTLYLAFRLLTGLRTTRVPDYPASLERAGWQLVEAHRKLGGMLTSELWRKAG